MVGGYFRHLVEGLLNPLFISLLVYGILVIALFRSEVSRRLKSLFLVPFILLLLFSTDWLPESLTRYLESPYTPVISPNPDVHWVVVLGGGQYEEKGYPANDILNSASLKRLVEGVRLYRQIPQATLLLSGDGYSETMPEASQMAAVVAWFGIPKRDVRLEFESDNTAGQALAIKAFVGDAPFYLVTSASHMSRALALCEKQGLHPIPAPTDFTHPVFAKHLVYFSLPSAIYLQRVTVALHEVYGRIWGWIVGDLRFFG